MDRTASVVPPTGGECCEGFTGVGEDTSFARYSLIAADDDVDEARIDFNAAAHAPRLVGGNEVATAPRKGSSTTSPPLVRSIRAACNMAAGFSDP